MKKTLTSLRGLCLTAALAAVQLATSAADATVPANLQVTLNGSLATLSWQRAGQTAVVAANDFEAAFLPEGWTQRTTNATDYRCSWFWYPTDDFKVFDDWTQLLGHGDRSALVYMDMGRHADKSYLQDEWLITPDIATGGYLDFYTYINPAVLEANYDEYFNDHYYVKLSRDGGNSWQVLWDARTDCSLVAGWHQVSIALGDCPAGSLVAFQALSDETDTTMPLHFSWGLDDISVSEGTTSQGSYYNVYLDGELLADHIQSLEFTDKSDKTVGSHTYTVTYVDAATGEESAAAEQTIEVGEASCPAPTNVTVNYEEGEDGTYDIYIAWQAPEGDRTPAYYNVYCNGKMAACWLEDLEFGNTGLARGVYEYTVTAVYEYPDGESEPVGDVVAVGTPYPATQLTADTENGLTTLTWQAPKASELTLAGYNVYRANMLLANCIQATTLTDATPAGIYTYAVEAVYTDGSVALPATAKVNGADKLTAIPYEQHFDGTLTPDDWQVENYSEDCDDAYNWRFDDWYLTQVSGEGFEGNYAAVESMNAGFVYVESGLVSPRFDTKVLNGGELNLDFDMDFVTEGESDVKLEYSIDKGETWFELEQLEGYSAYDLEGDATCAPVHKCIAVGDIAADGDIMFRWNYSAMWDGHLTIDNVRLSQPEGVGIEAINSNDATREVYSLNGTRLNTRTLPAGVYVVKTKNNNKKIVVR